MPRLQKPLTTISQSSRLMDPHGVMSIPWALLPYPSKSPERSSPNRASTERDAPCLDPSKNSQQFHRFPNGPLKRETSISKIFCTFPSKSLVNAPLPPCPPSGSPWREKLHLQGQWLIHSFIYVGVPNKEPSHTKGKNIRSPSTEPHVDGRPTCNGVRPGSPRGLFKTLQSLPQFHAAFSTIPSTLAWVDRSPASQPVS